jgi:hypothetical protein
MAQGSLTGRKDGRFFRTGATMKLGLIFGIGIPLLAVGGYFLYTRTSSGASSGASSAVETQVASAGNPIQSLVNNAQAQANNVASEASGIADDASSLVDDASSLFS